MEYYTAKNDPDAVDAFMDPAFLVKVNPDYYAPKFDAIKELREADDGTGYKGQEFRRVASFVNVPIVMALRMTDPEFLKDKRKLYALLDKYPEYVTYQRRNGGRGTARDSLKLPLSVLGLDVPGAHLAEASA